MPKVTDEHRRARRDEIAHAALRVLQRRGVANTSIAQIVAESGLSAGAIYANFSSKAELAQYVAGSLLDLKVTELVARPEGERTPRALVARMLGAMEGAAVPVTVVVQFWGEATADPELHRAVTETVGRLRGAFLEALQPWAEGHAAGEDPQALARRTAETMVTVCQGYIASSALFGAVPVERYLDGLTTAFSAS